MTCIFYEEWISWNFLSAVLACCHISPQRAVLWFRSTKSSEGTQTKLLWFVLLKYPSGHLLRSQVWTKPLSLCTESPPLALLKMYLMTLIKVTFLLHTCHSPAFQVRVKNCAQGSAQMQFCLYLCPSWLISADTGFPAGLSSVVTCGSPAFCVLQDLSTWKILNDINKLVPKLLWVPEQGVFQE